MMIKIKKDKINEINTKTESKDTLLKSADLFYAYS